MYIPLLVKSVAAVLNMEDDFRQMIVPIKGTTDFLLEGDEGPIAVVIGRTLSMTEIVALESANCHCYDCNFDSGRRNIEIYKFPNRDCEKTLVTMRDAFGNSILDEHLCGASVVY